MTNEEARSSLRKRTERIVALRQGKPSCMKKEASLADLATRALGPAAARVQSGLRTISSPLTKAPRGIPVVQRTLPRAPNTGFIPAPTLPKSVNPTLMANQQVQGAFDALPEHVRHAIGNSELVRAGVPAPLAYNLAYMSKKPGETGISSAVRHSLGGGARGAARPAVVDAATRVTKAASVHAFYDELLKIMEAA